MDKTTNEILMKYAEDILSTNAAENKCPLFKCTKELSIYDSYNGQISALGVSILMIGLCPTLAVYIQDKPSDDKYDKAYRIFLLEIIAKMLVMYKEERYNNIINRASSTDDQSINKYKNIRCEKAYRLVRYAFSLSQDKDQEKKELKTDILHCSIALKSIIRTYNLR